MERNYQRATGQAKSLKYLMMIANKVELTINPLVVIRAVVFKWVGWKGGNECWLVSDTEHLYIGGVHSVKNFIEKQWGGGGIQSGFGPGFPPTPNPLNGAVYRSHTFLKRSAVGWWKLNDH